MSMRDEHLESAKKEMAEGAKKLGIDYRSRREQRALLDYLDTVVLKVDGIKLTNEEIRQVFNYVTGYNLNEDETLNALRMVRLLRGLV